MDNTQDDNKKPYIPEPDPSSTAKAEKDPHEWITGAESMTSAQKSYLQKLAQDAGEEFDENLSTAQAAKRIEELQEKTGRTVSKDDSQGTGS